MATIIDGKTIAKRIRDEIAGKVEQIKKGRGFAPKLTVILIGEDPASQVYVRNKEKDCEAVGIISETRRLPSTTKQKQVIDLIDQLNRDKKTHGILVQLPLPGTIDQVAILNKISPDKDVDGLHPLNMGKLLRGEGPKYNPCTAQGVLEMILSTGEEIKGKEAVVVGRSNIVGKPTALMLLERHATVTICHSRTKDLTEVCLRGDILVAAVGSPEIIRGNMIKKGAIVIDVGVNRVGDKLVGDVEYAKAIENAAYISPVPGGVGPMTRAILLKNTIKAAETA